MKNKGKKESIGPDKTLGVTEFKGYTLEELKYQRALLLLKREFLKEKALKESKAIKNRIPMLNGKSPLNSLTPQGIVGRVARGLNYADYLMLGFSVFNAGKRIFSLFKKKKR